jgi:hypothetical protein
VLADSERHAHTATAAAHAFGTAFWWSAAIAAFAIIPCIVLMRAESNSRTEAAVIGAADPDEVVVESGAEALV